ncbi:nucleotidyltransferase domain-containing protein [Pseudomonas stutzeri]|nr:nucleotidyltransferase domain-containing protein [Stutzerimonas stutzeri]
MPPVEPSQLYLEPRHLDLLRSLLRVHVPTAEVWAYGSRVRGGAHEASDLDLVLRNPANPSREVCGWLELQEALQASSMPILVEVHLWSSLPADFLREIERSHLVIQCGDNEDSVKVAGEGAC